MTSLPPPSKRIKRHIIGRDHNFFAATAPGFEPLCQSELLRLQPTAGKTAATPGGVEFTGRLDVCYHANLNLRSANRILMRIHSFRSSNFRQLDKKIQDIPWELYLQPGSLLNVHVTTKHCRLHHSGAISEKCRTAITRRLPDIDLDDRISGAAAGHENIFIRGLDDRFSISIDSSGELLYKRGLKKHSGKAPLRETLAAAALLLAGYDSREVLLDPLCGAGTFSLEAALMAKRIPAGWFRDFAFTQWPSFLTKRWNYIRRQSASGFVRSKQPIVFASDTDPEACQKLKGCVERFELSDTIQVHQKDFFDLAPREFSDRPGIVCLNPPYGHRLGEQQESEKFFGAICDRLRQAYRGWKLVLFAPGRKLANTVPFQTESHPVLHGGLKLRLLVGRIK
jgi:putative N6-adenine-specific DNA methylase